MLAGSGTCTAASSGHPGEAVFVSRRAASCLVAATSWLAEISNESTAVGRIVSAAIVGPPDAASAILLFLCIKFWVWLLCTCHPSECGIEIDMPLKLK
jgi:hypothetical protein